MVHARVATRDADDSEVHVDQTVIMDYYCRPTWGASQESAPLRSRLGFEFVCTVLEGRYGAPARAVFPVTWTILALQ